MSSTSRRSSLLAFALSALVRGQDAPQLMEWFGAYTPAPAVISMNSTDTGARA